MSGDQGPPEDVGSVAEEAAKLLGALTGWAKDTAHDVNHAAGEHLATGAPECTYCPICRTVHVVRQTSPEVRAHLASAAASLMQAAAGILATAVPDGAGGGRAGPAAGRGAVERIDLDDDGDTTGAWPGEDDA